MITLLAAVSVFSSNVSGQTPVTSPPPAQIVFVPLSNAVELVKHPVLPVLYVASAKEPESKNLVTYRLNPDGTIAAGSKKVFGDYFGLDVKDPALTYRLLRPTVAADLRILYLGVTPENLTPARLFVATNSNELAAVALDEQGQPKGLLKAFRTDATKVDILMNIKYIPAWRRLFSIYWVSFGWCDLGQDGLPVSQKLSIAPAVNYSVDRDYAADWQRFYARSYAVPSLTVCQTGADGTGVDFMQAVAIDTTSPRVTIVASVKFRKLYIVAGTPGERLIIFRTTDKGHITGLPRYVAISENAFARFDLKANLLYAFTSTGILNIHKLDAHGYPSGQPTAHQLACGEVRDAIVDEQTGKVYVACSQPPVGDGMEIHD